MLYGRRYTRRAGYRVFGGHQKACRTWYLQPGAGHRATAVQRAIERLRSDLIRNGVICDGDLSRSHREGHVGHSTGGGEVTRYVGRHGTELEDLADGLAVLSERSRGG
jgi:hypothetical protein